MQRLRSVLRLAILCLLVVGAYSTLAQGPIAQHSGEISVNGLNDSVEILRDEWGVPHIYASNVHDLLFAQGYTQAQDRWWQMELFRHTANGRIQELTGQNDNLMGTDAFLRTLGFRQLVERELAEVYDDETKAMLQSFADGVNAYILEREPGELAYEYGPLRLTGVTLEIEPWTPADTVIWGKMMAFNLGGNEDTERLFARLYEQLDAELLEDYIVDPPYGFKPTIEFPEDLPVNEETASVGNDVQEAGITGVETELVGGFEYSALPFFERGPGIGSNNWVAGGSITESGLPLMANDMHLSIMMPSIWYEIGLHCMPVSEDCPYNAVGFTFAPSIMVVAGHNDYISWAHTNVGPDTQDLYMIRVNPDNELQYEWDGEWRDMTTREETLFFGNDVEPFTFTVRETHLGPIINDTLTDFNNENPVALRWTTLEPEQLTTSLMLLNKAENWDDFREALSYWHSPSQNLIYADTEGNIGYQMPGRIPIRAENHTGELPVPGWTSEFEWRGYIPYDLLPRIWNPERGYIATANQVAVPLEYYDSLAEQLDSEFGEDANYMIHRRYAYGYRGDRINTLLEELAPHNQETFQQIHGDNYDGTAAELLPYFAELEVEDETLADMRDWLVDWDYQMHMDSPQGALWANVWVALAHNLFRDQLGDIGVRGANSEWWAAYLLMQEPANRWWDDITTDDIIETRDDILLRSLEQGYENTAALLGENRDEWRWGTLHTTTFVSNPLGQSGIAPVEAIVNRGPFPTSGTGSAINATGWRAGSADFSVPSGPSERVIYDLSDWSKSLSIHTTGESGLPASEHYDDMIQSWLNIEYRTMLWTREQVEEAAVDTLVLTPA